jgi:hypothetical protein
VSREEYHRWRKNFLFDALRGHRFGASFCRQFGIQDYRLQFSHSIDSAENIIERDWLVSA